MRSTALTIGELVAKFCHYSDHGDWDALATCFTADVVTSIAGAATYVGVVAAQIAHAQIQPSGRRGRTVTSRSTCGSSRSPPTPRARTTIC